jgi:uncharacterized protein (DUF58 family)
MSTPGRKTETAGVDDSLVHATPQDLIALRQQARFVPLSAVKIISPKSGNYLSPFKGRGMEYIESRPYQPGDDVRNLDWRVTARSGKTYTKQFREERERTVLMWVDYRSTMRFATRGVYKSVMAARAAALLSWSAVHQGDRVGGLIFDDQSHQELRPQSGDKAVLHFIKQLCKSSDNDRVVNAGHVDHPPAGAATSNTADDALSRLRRVTLPGSLAILISDFRNLGSHSEAHLMQLTRHNDVILIFIYDPLESDLPPAGMYRVSDGMHSKLLDTSNAQLRKDYQNKFQRHLQYLQSLSRRYGMFLITCATDQSLERVLQQGLRLKRI